jgi:hypothetical protein
VLVWRRSIDIFLGNLLNLALVTELLQLVHLLGLPFQRR